MDSPGDGGGGGGGGGGVEKQKIPPITCFAIVSFHGIIPLSTDGDEYRVDAKSLPQEVSVVVSPNNVGYPLLLNEKDGAKTYSTIFAGWARNLFDKTPESLSASLNAFENPNMENLKDQMSYQRRDVDVIDGATRGSDRRLTSFRDGIMLAGHNVVDFVEMVNREAQITWGVHYGKVVPLKLFDPYGANNKCSFYFPQATPAEISELQELPNKLPNKLKAGSEEDRNLFQGLSLKFENNVLEIMFNVLEIKYGGARDRWKMCSLDKLFILLKSVISFSLGPGFVLQHMSNCCIADSACSVFAVRRRFPDDPRQEITILGPKTDSPASASAGGATTLLIDVHNFGSRLPSSYWKAFDQLKQFHKQQLAAAPRPAGSTLHELVIPPSLTSFLPRLKTPVIIHEITPIFNEKDVVIGMKVIYKHPDGSKTDKVVLYEPNQPIMLVDGRDDDDVAFKRPRSPSSVLSRVAHFEDTPPQPELSSPEPSPPSSPVFHHPPPHDGGRRCSKKKKNRSMKNKNRTTKNRNRSMKNRKTIRNKRKRKNMSVRRRG
jgi:hypothetical protein